MAVTTYCFNLGLYNIVAGNIHFLTDTFKVCLLPSTYTPNIDTQQYYSDISPYECPETGNYTAGGATLVNKTLTNDITNDRAVFDADDPSWSNLTQADIRYAVLYKDTGSPSTSVLLICWDFGATQSPSGVTFTLPIPAAGLFYLAKG
jgi:hypothetical protein